MTIPRFEVALPTSAAEWDARRPELRRALWELLGDIPPPGAPDVRVVGTEQHEGYRAEKIEFQNGVGDRVFGYVLVPAQPTGAAVLYCHYHGGFYDLGKDELFREPLFPEWSGRATRGEELARAGYVVLAIDAYAFGERTHQGPAGTRESGHQTEHALFKRFLWEGRTLWGMMLHDDLLALSYLAARPEVDPARIAATGASMGGSRSTWLAALDDRVSAVAPVAQYTRYQDLLASGDVNRHGIYYYVPGVLQAGLDMEAIVALAAPRPQLVLVGDADALSPPSGISVVNTFARNVYSLYDAEERFEPHVLAGVGHAYTPAMFGRAWIS
jgi:dienelactone hydrolase